jgi:hypothetical protein
MQAADADAEGVIEYSRGQSALFARRPRFATPIKGMHPEGVRHESRMYFFGGRPARVNHREILLHPYRVRRSILGKSTGGVARLRRALPPPILFDAFGV